MTTDQMIDGVPRELLERITAGPSQVGYIKAWKELRALLDAPTCKTPSGAACPGDGVGPCKKCPSAQPHGEPVAYEKPHYDNHYGYAGGYVDWGCPRDVRAVLDHVESVLDSVPEGPLYAEQPAPVAVVLPERREPTQDNPYLSDADHEWNAFRDELKRLNPSL